MRAASAGLRAFIEGASTKAIILDLVTLVTTAGATYRWTNSHEDVTTGGNTFTAGGTGTAPLLGPVKVRDALGLEPAEVQATLRCGTSAAIGGVPLVSAARLGTLDGAAYKLERAYFSAPGVLEGTINRFEGRVAEVEPTSSEVSLTVRSALEDLNQALPRNLFRSLCIHAVFDAGCGLTRATYEVTGSAQSGSTATSVQTGIVTGGTGYFNGGELVFTSGALAGVRRVVATFTVAGSVGTFTFTEPLPSAPAASDGVTAAPGCDKTATICNSRYSNLNRRRGFDFVPPKETVAT